MTLEEIDRALNRAEVRPPRPGMATTGPRHLRAKAAWHAGRDSPSVSPGDDAQVSGVGPAPHPTPPHPELRPFPQGQESKARPQVVPAPATKRHHAPPAARGKLPQIIPSRCTSFAVSLCLIGI